MKILVSGANSGLGSYLLRFFGADSFTRDSSLERIITNNNYDVIIHCAANPNVGENEEALASFIEDNLILTRDLLKVQHKYFIYISSIDVYSKIQEFKCSENQKIYLSDLKNEYSIVKLMSESLVRKNSCSFLILRPSAMLGSQSRPNSLIKLLSGKSIKLGISGDSNFNYILHEDVGKFINRCIEKRIEGIYNLASIDNISLNEVVQKFNLKNVTFGDFKYSTGDIDTAKLDLEGSLFNKTSMEVIDYYYKYLRSFK
jgi:nucleoside-diphosphate-sugar epimerase